MLSRAIFLMLLLNNITPSITNDDEIQREMVTENPKIEFSYGIRHPIRAITVTGDKNSSEPLLMYVGINALKEVVGVQILINQQKFSSNSGKNCSNTLRIVFVNFFLQKLIIRLVGIHRKK